MLFRGNILPLKPQSAEEFLVEIDQVEFFGGAGEGGVEPLEVLDSEGVLPEGVVDEDALPLAALGLVAGDGGGVLDLQGVGTAALRLRLVEMSL